MFPFFRAIALGTGLGFGPGSVFRAAFFFYAFSFEFSIWMQRVSTSLRFVVLFRVRGACVQMFLFVFCVAL